MIHEIASELGARLSDKGVPIPVVDGPENPSTMWGRERIVVEHADEADSFGPPRSQHINPKHRFTRTMACKLTIWAKAQAPGASIFEHRRRAEKILDKAICAMAYVAAVRKNRWEPKSGKFITPPDLAGAENAAGAVYELAFNFDRAVMDQTWAGGNASEFTIAAYAMAGNPDLTFAADDSSLTRSAGSWLTEGFAPGMAIRVTGTASNSIEGVIDTVDATVITLVATSLTDESSVSNCTVEAGGVLTTTMASRAQGPDDDSDPNNVPAAAEIAFGD